MPAGLSNGCDKGIAGLMTTPILYPSRENLASYDVSDSAGMRVHFPAVYRSSVVVVSVAGKHPISWAFYCLSEDCRESMPLQHLSIGYPPPVSAV